MESKLEDEDHGMRLQEDVKKISMEKRKVVDDISKMELQVYF